MRVVERFLLFLAIGSWVFGATLAIVGGCTGQIGRVPEQQTQRVVDARKVFVGSPGSDIVNVEVGASIVGALIVGAMFVSTIRSTLYWKRMTKVLSRAVERAPHDITVREEIQKEAAKAGLTEVDIAKMRRKVGTLPK